MHSTGRSGVNAVACFSHVMLTENSMKVTWKFAEIGHEGHSLGAESTEHPEEPKGAKEKADSRAPTVGLSPGPQEVERSLCRTQPDWNLEARGGASVGHLARPRLALRGLSPSK